MPDDAPDAGQTDVAPSRRRRAVARAKIALALIAPAVGLAALFVIARSSGNADTGQVTDAHLTATPVATAAATPEPTTPQAGFTNHWLS